MTRKRVAILASVVVAVVGAFVTDRALAAGSPASASYRTAVVKRATISQTLQRGGTIEPVAQATIAFPIAGTIAGVAVTPGQGVTAGQTLATIDPTTLQATVTSKQSQVAAAQLTLAKALSGATSSASSAASRSSSSDAALRQARDGVVGAQHDVDTASASAAAALQQATATCSAQDSSSSSDCLQALQQSLHAQQTVSTAQSVVAQTESALADLLSRTQAAASAPQQSAAASSPSAADLVADQAAVDAAQADLTAAQQALAQATIVSPLDGTVAAVNLSPGQQVTAASSSANVVVVGPGGYEVSTTVPVTDVGSLKLGDDARVRPDGTDEELSGQVVAIGLTPSTSGSTTTYPVVVGLSGSPDGLRNGASASVTITVAHGSDTLAVPTSAVRGVGGGGIHVVTVLAGSKTSVTPVTVGTVGSDFTEIKSGLTEGQTVVVADLSEPLPSLANTNLNRLGRGVAGGGIGRAL